MKNLALSSGLPMALFLSFGFGLSWLALAGIVLLFIVLSRMPRQLFSPHSALEWEGLGMFCLGVVISLFGCIALLKGYGECGAYSGPMCAIWKLSSLLFGREHALAPTVAGILALSGVFHFIGLQRLNKASPNPAVQGTPRDKAAPRP